ncbi:MAG: hypothetical protein MUF83_08035 [Acidimicrobiales bacterium]|jgi:hypothetical protein|nr:hypothetical protein [Acidimicrobiales bacterium]
MGRRTGAATGIVVVVLALVLVAVQVRGDGTSARGQLRGRLAGAEAPERYSFRFRGGGTEVLDCFLANRRFTGQVDTEAGRLAIDLDPSTGGPVAVVDIGEAMRVHRSLFDDPPFPSEWLTVELPADASTAEDLRRVLGADLSAKVLSSTLPPPGRAVVAAALEVADQVVRIEQVTVDGEVTDGFRISIEPSRYAQQAATELSGRRSPPADPDEVMPEFDVWVDGEGWVWKVTVRPKNPDGTNRPAEEAWTTEYLPQAESVPAMSGEATNARTIDLSALAPARRDCEVG